MPSERNVTPAEKQPIDYSAIREGKAEMVERFNLARKKAEQQGSVVIKPL